MDDAQESPLAAALAALLQQERVSVTEVARMSGLWRNTIVAILSGRTRRPPPRTLHRLAAAIATDPVTREQHRQKTARFARVLLLAAGYADPAVPADGSFLEIALYYELQSEERAVAWVRLIRRCRALTAAEIAALDGGAEA